MLIRREVFNTVQSSRVVLRIGKGDYKFTFTTDMYYHYLMA